MSGPQITPVDYDPFKAAPPNPAPKPKVTPVDYDPFAKSSAVGAAARHAGREALPSAAGFAGFAAGATAAGTLSVPLEAIPVAGPFLHGAATLAGGLAGAFGAGSVVSKVQDKVLPMLPTSVQKALGQDQAQRQADETQHPYASFAGSLAPGLVTMRPGLRSLPVTAGASRVARIMATPAGGAAVGGTIGGGLEAAREAKDGKFDPVKLGIATVVGAAENRPTRIGAAMFRGSAGATVAGMKAAARPAGRAYQSAVDIGARVMGQKAAEAAPDFDNMRSANPRVSGALPGPSITPVGGDPFAAAPVEPVVPPAPVMGAAGAREPFNPNLIAPVGAPQPPGPISLPAPSVVEPQPVIGGTPQGGDGGLRPAATTIEGGTASSPMRVGPGGDWPEPGELAEGGRYVTTPAGKKIQARFEVVPAASLVSAEGALQNRDRSRDTTDLQVQDIVSKFDPSRLGPSAETDRGAPIVGPDHVVESGNGRMLALNRILSEPEHKAKALAYRDYIESLGHSTAGIENPVLIRRNLTQLTPEQRRQFVVDSNKDTKLELSPTERARSDADSITPDMLDKYAGGDLNSTANQGFVEHFNRNLTAGELGNMIGSDRRLTTTGKQRLENAIVARAYGKPKLLERMMESANDDIRAITGSMADVAVPWVKMRQAVETGEIPAKYDITDHLAAAAARVSDARKGDVKPRDVLSQADAFDPIHPIEAALVESFYNKGMTRAASRKAVSEFLHDYVKAAHSQTTTEGLFGAEEPKEPADVIRGLLERRDNPDGAAMLDAPLLERQGHDTERAPQGHEEGHDGRHAQGEEDVPGASEEGRRSGGSRGSEPAGQAEPGRGVRPAESPGDGGQGREVDEAPAYSAGIAPTPGVAGPYDPKFATASFTNRTSIFTSAAAAVGMEFDKFNLLPAPRQVVQLQRAIYTKYGVEVTVDKGMQERFAIDQMLDAFQNLQGMAHALGLPEDAINLGGTLKLHLQKGGNFLGVFYPGKGMIALPKRSNSFAHEWGHALDYFLLNHMPDAEGKGLSGAVRKEGTSVLDDPKTVSDAFVGLLNAMFFDKAGAATKILALEAKIASTKSGKVKADAEAQIRRLKEGNSQARDISTAFHQNAKAFDGAGDYWSSPTEMMARSFEAYVSFSVEARGLTTELIGKGDAAYLSSAEERFAKTFPKGAERAEIFAAYDKLFAAIAKESLLGRGAAADAPDGLASARRLTDLDKTPAVAKAGVWERQKAAISAWRNQRAKEIDGRIKDPKSLREKTEDFASMMLRSMEAQGRMIQKRSGSGTLNDLLDMLTPRSGDGSVTVGRTFHERVQLHSRQTLNRIGNVLKEHGIEERTAALDKQLTQLLTSGAGGNTASPSLVAAASKLRAILDGEWHRNQAAGIDLGYTRNGYLQRQLDRPRVYNDPRGFVADSSRVYEIMFDNEFGQYPAALLANEETWPEFRKLARQHAKDTPEYQRVADLLKQMARLERAKKTSDDPDAIDAKLAALQPDLETAVGELMDVVRPLYARQRAEAWHAKIGIAGTEYNASAPDAQYLKSRELPPEADQIMAPWYVQDPIERIINYVEMSSRRTAYAQLFGPKGEKLGEMLEQMRAEGVGPDDLDTVHKIATIATGRRAETLPKAIVNGLSAINAYGLMALLPRAVIASIAEPATAALVSGEAKDAFLTFGRQLGAALDAATPEGYFDNANAKQRHQLVRALGIIEDLGTADIVQARYGNTYAEQTRYDRWLSRMFTKTGLVQLTNSQKTAAVGTGHAFIDNLASIVLDPEAKSVARAAAVAQMRELGVRDPQGFSQWVGNLHGQLPTPEQVDTPEGYDYSTAQFRFSTMTVQEPDAMNKPLLAHNPAGRLIYSISGFSFGYLKNVPYRLSKIIQNRYSGKGGYEKSKADAGMFAGKIANGLALAFVFGTTVSTIREFIYNRERFKQKLAEGPLAWAQFYAALGFTRTFSFGYADTILNTLSGLRYNRGLENLFVGATPSFIVDNVAKIAKAPMNNSRKTNAAEYGALRSAYQLASPAVNVALSMAPGGPIAGPAAGAAMTYATSSQAADRFATAIVGPKNGSIGPDGKKVKSGPTAYDRALDSMFGKVERKKKADAAVD